MAKKRQKKEGGRSKIARGCFVLLLAVLLLASFLLNLLAVIGTIDLEASPFRAAELSISILLWAEYLLRFLLARSKGEYFLENFVELVSLLPFSPVLGLLHLVRLLALCRVGEVLHRLFPRHYIRIARWLRSFLGERGFLYGLCAFVLLFLCEAEGVSLLEKGSFFPSCFSLLFGAASFCLGGGPKSFFGDILSGFLFSLFCALAAWFVWAARTHANRVKRLRGGLFSIFPKKISRNR